MPTGTPAGKKATPRAAAGTAASKPAAPIAEKKAAAAPGGSGAAAASGSSTTGHSTSKAGKTPRKSIDGSPSAGRRASNSSAGTSGAHEKSAKGTKTGATTRAAASGPKQATDAAARPASDADMKNETCPAVQSEPPSEPPAAPAADDASAPASSQATGAADDGGVDVTSTFQIGADEKSSQNTGDAAATESATNDAPGGISGASAAARHPPLICLVGPPCSGKGTLSHLVKQQLGLEHISTGDLLREAAKDQGEDSQIAELMKSGGLVQDDVVAELLKKSLERLVNSRGALLDGFPRNAEQVKLMDELQLSPRLVVVLKVPPEVLQRRLAARRLDPVTGEVFGEGCEPQDEQQRQRLIQRDDDKPEILQKRLNEYTEEVDSILSIFKEISCRQAEKECAKRTDAVEDEQQQIDGQPGCKIVEIDGDRDVTQVFAELSPILEKVISA